MPKEQPVVEYYEKYTQNTFYFKASYFKRIETKTKIKIKLKLQNLAHTSASCRLIGKTHLLLGIPAIDYNVSFAPFLILCKEISQGLAARASTQGGMQEPCAPATGGFPCPLPSLFPSQYLQQAQHLFSTAGRRQATGEVQKHSEGSPCPFLILP